MKLQDRLDEVRRQLVEVIDPAESAAIWKPRSSDCGCCS